MDTREITLHGHHVSYRTAGDGPEVVVLIHGITGSADTWAEVIPALAEEFTVLAPDLLGHGHSAKPRGDYSLGAYASGVRDLVAALGHDHATVVGHSLGGGVAMQQAFVHTLRTIVDGGGQRVSATDRLYLAAEVPTLIVWGESDPIIPVAHGIEAQEAIPGSRLELFERAGHFPHRSDPDRFADLLIDFVEDTVPADVDDDRWREMLRAGASA